VTTAYPYAALSTGINEYVHIARGSPAKVLLRDAPASSATDAFDPGRVGLVPGVRGARALLAQLVDRQIRVRVKRWHPFLTMSGALAKRAFADN